MKIYHYNGKTYNSLLELRYDATNLIFPPDPDEELLAGINITVEVVEDVGKTPEEIAAELAMDQKRQRAEAIATIQVQVDDMIFDGDERSQSRMAKTVMCWDPKLEWIEWIDSSNQIVTVTKDQLQKALELAVREMNRLWIEYFTPPTENELIIGEDIPNDELPEMDPDGNIIETTPTNSKAR